MTKQLVEAAGVVLNDYRKFPLYSRTLAGELKGAIVATRQPVTVTEEQAVELIIAFNTAADGDDPTQEEIDGLTDQNKLEITEVITAVLQKARELGL